MGKFDKYRIDLKGIQENSITYEFLLDNLFFTNIDAEEVQKGKVEVVLTIKKTSHTFELNFQIDGSVWVPCDRCLDDVEVMISSSDKLLVKFGVTYGEEGDNLIIVPESEGDINLAWFMYEFISLAVPMKHVHAPGKCNRAMTGKLNKHLRTESDDVDNEFGDTEGAVVDDIDTEAQIDPRWNELKKILDNN